MKIFVGLGNPGKEYEKTRHNVGFLILEKLNKGLKLEEFRYSKKFNSEVSNNKNFILLMPQTFMNKSGEAVSRVVKFYKADLNELVVIHDDVDLPLGKIKIGFAEGTAGHNGVASIVNLLGSKNFWRVRVGVGTEIKSKIETDKFVLAKFTQKEQAIINKIMDEISSEIKNILEKEEIKSKGISLN